MSTVFAVGGTFNTADNASAQPLPTDLICSYCPIYPSSRPPSSPIYARRHYEPRPNQSRGHRRHSSTIPLKRTMNLDLSQDTYDGSVSISRFAPNGNTEEAVASPIRNAFFNSSKSENQLENGSGRGPLGSFSRPRSSASTSTSASPESSPTACASIAESVSTPGTSPDTPASAHSYNYPSLSSMAMQGSNENKSDFRPPPTPAHKKPRNLKNLAVNTSSNFPLAARAISTASFPIEHVNSPTSNSSLSFSPSFAPPLASPRRRPSGPGLTIQTPAFDTFPRPLEIPPVAQLTRLSRPETLRHFQSTPSLPLDSANYAIESPIRTEFERPRFSEEPRGFVGSQLGAPYDLPESLEKQPAAYPNGPITIYEPYVDLYFEPTAEEASKYEVIVNVASEVQNPFRVIGNQEVVAIDLKAAVAALTGSESSPSTPKPGAPQTSGSAVSTGWRPEYIHIPWEHNTDIVPGTNSIPPLHDIIRLIDSRVIAGKRVLIHCQCGVSRSASLIVAYGLYKNPNITVQEAYDAVKQRSEWIGPNMNLIMQLQEFRNILRGELDRSFFRNGFKQPAASKQSQEGNLPGDVIPRTAPLPQPTIKPAPPPVQTRNLRDVSPGPSSAPSDFHRPSPQRDDSLTPTNTVMPVNPETAVVNPTGQVLPTQAEVPAVPSQAHEQTNGNKKRLAIRTGNETVSRPLALPPSSLFSHQQQPLESPRGAQFAMAPVRVDEGDEMLGITSPRPIELTPPPTFSPSPTASPSSPHQGQLESLSSPRATQFAMTSIYQPEFDQTFGLTSPRSAEFPSLIPTAEPTASRFAALYPQEEASAANADARAELRAQLGLNSTRSSQDMRAGFNRAMPIPNVGTIGNKATAGGTSIGLSVSMPAGGPSDSDALMSPRATEFTSNPFKNLLDEASSAKQEVLDGGGASQGPAGEPVDPRSPPLKGANPIVRNILDVL